MRVHADQSSLFGYYSPATGEVTSHPPLCACGQCSMPVEAFDAAAHGYSYETPRLNADGTLTTEDTAADLSGVQTEESN